MERNAFLRANAFRRAEQRFGKLRIRPGAGGKGIVLRERVGQEIAARAVPADRVFRHDDVAQAHGRVKRAHRADKQAVLTGREPKRKRHIRADRRADVRFDEGNCLTLRGRHIPHHGLRIGHRGKVFRLPKAFRRKHRGFPPGSKDHVAPDALRRNAERFLRRARARCAIARHAGKQRFIQGVVLFHRGYLHIFKPQGFHFFRKSRGCICSPLIVMPSQASSSN